MTKTIFLCASMAFYKELVEIESALVERGFTVKIPVSAGVMKRTNDFEVSHFKDAFSPAQKAEFVRTNFDEIANSDAILVINNEKNGIKGYIGANVLMEIGLAFYLRKKIFVWNELDPSASSREELLAFGVKYVNRDLEQILV